MNKSILTKILILFIISILSFGCANTYALGDIIKAGDDFIKTGSNQSPIDETTLKSISNDIYNILFVIAVIVSVVVAAILGIQFMIGSIDDKAKVKETLIPFVIGCFCVYGAFGIWKLVIVIFQTT